MERTDRLVVGAGAFGLYAADVLARRGHRVVVIDGDPVPFRRASTVNQARLHQGYHYPRSVYTARQTAKYFERFIDEFGDAVNDRFDKIYAIARADSHTSAAGFERFCRAVGIPLTRIDTDRWFDPRRIERAWSTCEHSIDPHVFRELLLTRVNSHGCVDMRLGHRVTAGIVGEELVDVTLEDGTHLRAGGLVNATYADTNGVLDLLGIPPLRLRHELCEVTLVEVPDALAEVGITVMDGPFWSLMPYGGSGLHSLTAVPHTPRRSSSSRLPTFPCQARRDDCRPQALAHCGTCPEQPPSGFAEMLQLARLHLADTVDVTLRESLMTVKTVLATAAVDDSRPSLMLRHPEAPNVTTVFSGKINTVFDLEALP